MAIKKLNPATEFEKMLMWTSYRYCIGRHSYVTAMADDIGINFYSKLTEDERLRTAKDICRQIKDCLHFLPFSFVIDKDWSDNCNPINILMQFFRRADITCMEELADYCEVCYDSKEDKFHTEKRSFRKLNSYISVSDIEDLLVWDRLANLFDNRSHRMVTLIDGSEHIAFPEWVRDSEFIDRNEFGYDICRLKPFGWHIQYKPLNEFIAGKTNLAIPKGSIKIINELLSKENKK